MNESCYSIDTEAIRPYTSLGNQWNESDFESSVEPTPPSASSLDEQTPAGLDYYGSSNAIGQQGTYKHSSRAIESSKAELASAIENIVLSLTETTSPLTRQQAWASVQAIASAKIAQIVEKETPQALESTHNDITGCPRHRSTCLVEQGASRRSFGTSRIPEREVNLDLQQDEQLTIGHGPLSNRLDISLRISAGGPLQGSPSRNNSRVDKNRSRWPRRLIPCNGDASSPRRGRPSERGFTCSHCAIAKKKSPIYRHLCIKADFKESRFLIHDLYKTRIRTLLDNVVRYTWRDPNLEPIIIKVSNGFNAQLEIELQHYVAQDEDALAHKLFRGLEAGMICPIAGSTSFALLKGTLTAEKIDQYCERMACDMIVKESLDSAHNSLLNHIVLFAAAQINHEDAKARIEGLEMVRLALRFWAIQAIFFTYQWRIERGGHLIGMSPLQLPGYWNNITLLPRLVNQELDRAFEKRMDEIEKEILEKLQVAIFKRHRDYWCSIFLSSFILLHSLEKDTWNMRAWEYEIGGRAVSAWPLRKSPSEYCDQNKHIADIIATHFKIVNQGNSPLKQNWNKPLNQQLLSNSLPARKFILSIQSDFHAADSNYKAELHRPKEFIRSDPQSLDYIYTQMLFGE
ncbi:hypothetical protein GGR58DRAFT_507768 [Xylaria digitata]|nr:hypothetical protein GGR58DRAFT_507768 [Xylaria digitata]